MVGEDTMPLLLTVVGTGDTGLDGVSVFTSAGAGGIGTGSTTGVGTLTTVVLVASRLTKFVVDATTDDVEHCCDQQRISLRRDAEGFLRLGRARE